jgi:hypothetical protein
MIVGGGGLERFRPSLATQEESAAAERAFLVGEALQGQTPEGSAVRDLPAALIGSTPALQQLTFRERETEAEEPGMTPSQQATQARYRAAEEEDEASGFILKWLQPDETGRRWSDENILEELKAKFPKISEGKARLLVEEMKDYLARRSGGKGLNPLVERAYEDVMGVPMSAPGAPATTVTPVGGTPGNPYLTVRR